MRARGLLGLLAALLFLLPAAGRGETPGRFRPVEVWLDSGSAPLAAYQVEITADGAEIVGVEGGAHAAFADPPHYDPAALRGKRIILAAFSTASDLPRGRSRVATLHMSETAGAAPRYRADVVASAGPDGSRIPVTVELVAVEGDPG